MKKSMLLALAASLGMSGAALNAQAMGHKKAKENMSGQGAPQSLTMEQLPPKVASTLDSKAESSGMVQNITSEVNAQGKTIYSAEVRKNGKGTNYTLDQNGKILSHKKEAAPAPASGGGY
jgi:hypothetical protein